MRARSATHLNTRWIDSGDESSCRLCTCSQQQHWLISQGFVEQAFMLKSQPPHALQIISQLSTIEVVVSAPGGQTAAWAIHPKRAGPSVMAMKHVIDFQLRGMIAEFMLPDWRSRF
jgi:hypothetical protein